MLQIYHKIVTRADIYPAESWICVCLKNTGKQFPSPSYTGVWVCLLSWQLFMIYSSLPAMNITSFSACLCCDIVLSFLQFFCLFHSGCNLIGAGWRCTVTQPDPSCSTAALPYLSSATQITAKKKK